MSEFVLPVLSQLVGPKIPQIYLIFVSVRFFETNTHEQPMREVFGALHVRVVPRRARFEFCARTADS
jgi:hypothetical protein